MRRLPTFWLLTALAPGAFAADDPCHPTVDDQRRQFIVGYGSLMEAASKQRSSPTSGLNHPVLVQGFERAWNARGAETGFSTTYLGVLAQDDAGRGMEDQPPSIAAVIYEDKERSDITGTDRRETFYCRHEVAVDAIDILDGWQLPPGAEVWIYALEPEDAHPPSATWPIVQSYVDIFLTGCMQLQDRILPSRAEEIDFPTACIRTTSDWSRHWKNDRLYPRRPFIYQPNAETIDKLLEQELPEFFNQIAIE